MTQALLRSLAATTSPKCASLGCRPPVRLHPRAADHHALPLMKIPIHVYLQNNTYPCQGHLNLRLKDAAPTAPALFIAVMLHQQLTRFTPCLRRRGTGQSTAHTQLSGLHSSTCVIFNMTLTLTVYASLPSVQVARGSIHLRVRLYEGTVRPKHLRDHTIDENT